MNEHQQREREQLLRQWAQSVTRAAHGGALNGGQPVQVLSYRGIPGPRAAVLELDAGVSTGLLLRKLQTDQAALARQFIPFTFTGEIEPFMRGRAVRVEAGWPADLAETDVKLADVATHPKGGGRWIVGKSETGATITLGFNDRTPSWLVSGTTGAGKSVAIHSCVSQIVAARDTQLVLIDGKFGESLQPLAHVRGLIGPLAMDGETARAALAWCVEEMQRRYANESPRMRLVIVIDEVQELVTDPAIAESVRRLTSLGRAANVHCLIGTQHPVAAALGDSASKRNIGGRLALRVTDFDASRAAIGARIPRADHLLGAGDAYACAPGAVHRVQVAYVPQVAFKGVPTGAPMLAEWPTADVAGALGNSFALTAAEAAHAVIAAQQGSGRPTLSQAMADDGLGRPGAERGMKMLTWGRDALQRINALGWELAERQRAEVIDVE